jgi:hypothetical protein
MSVSGGSTLIKLAALGNTNANDLGVTGQTAVALEALTNSAKESGILKVLNGGVDPNNNFYPSLDFPFAPFVGDAPTTVGINQAYSNVIVDTGVLGSANEVWHFWATTVAWVCFSNLFGGADLAPGNGYPIMANTVYPIVLGQAAADANNNEGGFNGRRILIIRDTADGVLKAGRVA